MTLITRWIAVAIFSTASCLSSLARAQDFPGAPVNIVVPYPAGGGADIMARALAAELSSVWGKPVVVENIPGANSIIGAQRVARAAPDGHTLLMTLSGTLIGNQFLYKSLPYDPAKSFVPISMIAKSGQLILASSSANFSSLSDMLESAKKVPGSVTYGTPGKGSQEEILMETISKRENVSLLSIPYKGVAPALTALLGGEIKLGVASPGLVAELMKQGRIKALAIAAPQRSSLLPGVPTTGELGLPYAISTVWYGLFAVAGTPESIVKKLSKDVMAIARNPDFVARNMTPRGLESVANSPSEFAAEIKAERSQMADMVRIIGLQPE